MTDSKCVLGRIADHLAGLSRPFRVAVDGITASGKTTLARDLAAAVPAHGRSGAHLSMDGFHNSRGPASTRLDSADGHYLDT